ncbi:MAG: 30S ribosomal protein S19 [Nitrosotalea sp.]
MVREFKYRGMSLEQLQGLSLEKLFELLPARARRSLTRGITDDKRKLLEETKLAKAGKLKTPIKTHQRSVIVLPYMVGLTISIYSGKEFLPVDIKPDMVGHYLGEFIMTNKRVVHGAPGVGASRSSLYVPLK